MSEGLSEADWDAIIDTLDAACMTPIPATGPLAEAVERIVAAREAAARAEERGRIARAIEGRTLPTTIAEYDEGWQDATARAARIARESR